MAGETRTRSLLEDRLSIGIRYVLVGIVACAADHFRSLQAQAKR